MAEPDVYRRVVEATRDGLVMFDASGVITFANSRMAELLGRDPAEMVGYSLLDSLDDGGQERFRRYLAVLDAAPDDDEGEDGREARLHRPDGSSIWVVVSHGPVRDDDGRRIGWLHRVTDQTEQKRLIDLAAPAREAAGRRAVDRADRQLGVGRRVGHRRPGPTSSTASTASTPTSSRRPTRDSCSSSTPTTGRWSRRRSRRRSTGEDEFAWDARIVRVNGEQRWVRGLGRVERGPDGAPLTMGGTAQDITEQIEVEQQAAEATRRLFLLQSDGQRRPTRPTASTRRPARRDRRTRVHDVAAGLRVPRPDADGVGEPIDLRARVGRPGARILTRAWPSRPVGPGCMEVGPVPGHEETHSMVAIPVLHRRRDRVRGPAARPTRCRPTSTPTR